MKKIFFILLGLFLFLYSVLAKVDLDKVKEEYFNNQRYGDFVNYLKDLSKKEPHLANEISYYIGLCRYEQLKYLEEAQDWDRYFKYGNDYREELERELKKVIKRTTYKDKINLYAQLILFRFYKDQMHPSAEEIKNSLMDNTNLYIKETNDFLILKDIADTFLIYQYKNEAEKLYRVYVENLVSLEKDLEKLDSFGANLLKENKLDLAVCFYDTYIERLIRDYPKEKVLPKLFFIGKEFSFKVNEFAERIFKLIEDRYGLDLFDEETLYLRAENLEKSLNYLDAQRIYLIFLEKFKESKYREELLFKTAVVYAYSLADLEKAKYYFNELLKEKKKNSCYGISSLYQLGLISQWQKNYDEAVKFYKELWEEAGDRFLELRELSQKRIEEIENDKPIEYNLKTFLDLSFSKEKIEEAGFLKLTASNLKLPKNESLEISALVTPPQTGCFSLELGYLWSGEVGSYFPSEKDAHFSTKYIDEGTKLVNLVVVTANGVLDKSYLMIDVLE